MAPLKTSMYFVACSSSDSKSLKPSALPYGKPSIRMLIPRWWKLLRRLEPRIESHFGRSLDGFEEPQFLRYGPGDYFVAHQDGNTPLVHDDSRFRKVSVVIFLSAPDTFSGGSLMLHPPPRHAEPPQSLPAAPGTLVAFPSETTHEVLPVTDGERLSVVSWYRG